MKMREIIDLIEGATEFSSYEILDEITLIPPISDRDNEMRRDSVWHEEIEEAHQAGEIGDLMLFLNEERPNQDVYFLIDADGKAWGRMRVDEVRENIVKVGHVWLDAAIRGKGYGFKLYEFLLNKGLNIVSDADQTIFSKNLWQKLAHKYVVRAYDGYHYGRRVKNIDRFYGDDRRRKLLIARRS